MPRGIVPAGTSIVAAMLALGAGHLPAASRSSRTSPSSTEWPSYGGTNWSQKYSPLDQINRDNFKNLAIAWTWTSPDHDLMTRIPDYPEMPLHANGLKATPLVVNGVMYIMTAYNLNTGDIAWQVPTGRGQN